MLPELLKAFTCKENVYLESINLELYTSPTDSSWKQLHKLLLGWPDACKKHLAQLSFIAFTELSPALQWFLQTVGLFAKRSLDNNCHKLFPWESIRTSYTVPCNRPLASRTYKVLILKQLLVFSMSQPTLQHIWSHWCCSSIMYSI